jgi:hypothetical protein
MFDLLSVPPSPALSDDRAALSSKLSSSLSSSHALSSLQSRVTELEDERAELVERQRDQELQHQSAMKHRVKEMQAITKLACEGEIEELTSQVRTLQAALADSRMQVVQAQQQQQLLLSSPGSSSRKHTRSITGVEEALSPPGSRQHSRSFTGAGDNALTTPGQPPQQLHQPPPGIAAMSQKIQAQSAEIQALQAKVRELERGAQAGQQQAAGEETNPPAAAPGPAAVVVHHRPAPAYSMQTPAPSPHHRHHHSLLLPSGGGPSTTPQHRHHHSLALPSAGPTPSALYIPASPSRGLMMSASPRSAGGPLSGPSEPLRTLTLNLRLIHFPLSLLLPPLHDRSTPSGTPLSPASITAGSRYLVLSVFIRSATVAGNAYHFVGMTERFLAQPTSSSSSVENSESGVPSGLLDVMWTKPIDLKHYMTSSQNELLFSLYAVEPNHTAATAAADGNTTAVPQDRREKIGSVVVHSYHLLTGIPTTSGDPSNSAAASSTSSPRQHMLLLEASPESENSNENEEDELDGGEDDGVHSSRLSRSAIVAKLNLELLHQREKETNAKHSHRELQRQVRNERREALAGGLTRLIISCTITPTLHMEALPSPPSSASSSSSSHRQQPHGGGFTSGLTPMSGRSGQHTPREPQTPTSGRFKEPSRTPSSGRSAREAPNSGRSDRERRSRSGTVHNLPTTQTSVVRQIILSPTPKRLIRSPQQLPSSTQQQQLTTRVVSSPGLLDPLDSSRFSSGPLSSDVITSPGLTPHQSGPKHPLAAMPWLQSAAVQELLAMDDSQASHDTSGGGVDFRTQIERMLHDNGISTSVSDARAGVITTSGTRHARAQSRTPDHRYAARTSEYDAQPQLAEDGEEGQPSLLEPGSPEADANNSLSFTVSPFTPCQPYAAFVKEQARLHPYVHADDLWTKVS